MVLGVVWSSTAAPKSSFSAFRSWFAKTKGKCYLDAVVEALDKYAGEYDVHYFSWQSQMGMFINYKADV